MPIDLAHFAARFVSPFDPSSRFYWPLVVAVVAGIAANIAWYYWEPHGGEKPSPAENTIKPWAFWVNVIFLIWALVLLMAKIPFYLYAISLALNVLALAYMYLYWLPPRDAAWARELRRLKYIPKPERRRRRRR
ncbi:MAG: hypothetical protein HYX56_03035 [Chloroflexi bacterium]|nr:hypothetical protein [Chloroflexota bacterium]